MAESVTHVPGPAPSQPVVQPAPKTKSKVGLLLGVGALLVVVLVAGVGGFLLWNKSRSNVITNTNTNTATPVVTTPVEFSRYWLVLEPAAAGGPTTQVAALVPIASGQFFKFHFVFNEEGYLYIFGPGDGNQPTAFLTTKPAARSGLTTNKVSKGVEFSFPKGADNSLRLDTNPGTDYFTVIFSKTPLASPSIFNVPVTGEPLPATEQADLKAFITKFQGTPPVTELDESTPRAPFVKVKTVPDTSGNPIVFQIRIQHN